MVAKKTITWFLCVVLASCMTLAFGQTRLVDPEVAKAKYEAKQPQAPPVSSERVTETVTEEVTYVRYVRVDKADVKVLNVDTLNVHELRVNGRVVRGGFYQPRAAKRTWQPRHPAKPKVITRTRRHAGIRVWQWSSYINKMTGNRVQAKAIRQIQKDLLRHEQAIRNLQQRVVEGPRVAPKLADYLKGYAIALIAFVVAIFTSSGLRRLGRRVDRLEGVMKDV